MNEKKVLEKAEAYRKAYKAWDKEEFSKNKDEDKAFALFEELQNKEAELHDAIMEDSKK